MNTNKKQNRWISNTWNSIQKHIAKYRYIYMVIFIILVVIFILLIIPWLVQIVMTKTSYFAKYPGFNDNDWIGFWGGYLGALIGAIVTIYAIRMTIKHEKSERINTEQSNSWPYIIARKCNKQEFENSKYTKAEISYEYKGVEGGAERLELYVDYINVSKNYAVFLKIGLLPENYDEDMIHFTGKLIDISVIEPESHLFLKLYIDYSAEMNRKRAAAEEFNSSDLLLLKICYNAVLDECIEMKNKLTAHDPFWQRYHRTETFIALYYWQNDGVLTDEECLIGANAIHHAYHKYDTNNKKKVDV